MDMDVIRYINPIHTSVLYLAPREKKLLLPAITDLMQSRNLFMIVWMRLDGLNLKYRNFSFF